MVSKKNILKKNNNIGQVFTPDYVAEFMVRNCIKFITRKNYNISEDFKVLEPSVGEGVFLNYLKKNSFSNIYAYEMDLSLKNTLLNSFPSIKFKFDNFLSSKISKKFDLIIGNPPYLGQNYNAEIFQEYIKKYPLCANYFVGNMDLFYFFVHLGIEKLKPGGFLSYITTNYWITKSQKTGIKLLKPHILDECYLLQYIDLSSLNIFEGARGQHNCIFVLQKKTEQEKSRKKNKNIQIIQTQRCGESQQIEEKLNKCIFKDLINNSNSQFVKIYDSALTNNDLNRTGNWNLVYPRKMKLIVNKIEHYCEINGNISTLQDYFIIRNGLILINDNIFILKEGKELKIEDDDFNILVNGSFMRLNEIEKKRLKRVFKSKSIKPYGYNTEDSIGYVLYFNKSEFNQKSSSSRNKLLEQRYPTLIKYLKQFELKLREILINAKENPDDFYYPRRGSFIRRLKEGGKKQLLDLEPHYDFKQKIFFKYISNENIFGYSNDLYYATSDTYFLWPLPNKNVDYLFTLAYLNSKLVSFLYKAKNIIIKRSKTKLEYGLPMPNLKNFDSNEKSVIVESIKTLVNLLISKDNNNLSKNIQNSSYLKLSTKHYPPMINNILKLKNKRVLENDDKKIIQNTIDKLFFELFNINENEINKLLKEYYNLPPN
jgi:adenine-specific DNA-methyltransferase